VSHSPARAKRFYAILGVAMLIGAAINFLHINPIEALVISATINGFITPPLLVLLLLVANKRDGMGDRTNGRVLNILGWGTVVVMIGGAIALLFTL
jgi:Mn2+/Fe2+ NRAMP family transporter